MLEPATSEERKSALQWSELQNTYRPGLLPSGTSDPNNAVVEFTDPRIRDALASFSAAISNEENQPQCLSGIVNQVLNTYWTAGQAAHGDNNEGNNEIKDDELSANERLKWKWLSEKTDHLREAQQLLVAANKKKDELRTAETKLFQDLQKADMLRYSENNLFKEQKSTINTLEKYLEPYLIAKDPNFKRLVESGYMILPSLIISELNVVESLLSRIDDAIPRIAANSHHRDSMKFKQMYEDFRERLCHGFRLIVNRSLERCEQVLQLRISKAEDQYRKRLIRKDQTEQINKLIVSKQAPGSPSNQTDLNVSGADIFERDIFNPGLYYVKFRAYGVNILPTTTLFLKRYAESSAEVYANTVYQLQGVYAGIRLRFVGKAFSMKIKSIISRFQDEPKDVVVRHATTFWLSTASLEVATYRSFFPPSPNCSSRDSILNSLGQTFYDNVRPVILQTRDLSVLRAICDCLTYDIVEPSNKEYGALGPSSKVEASISLGSSEMGPAVSVIVELFEDTQQKIIFESHRYLHECITRFDAQASDMNYPQCLEEASNGVHLYYPPVESATYCLSCLSGAVQTNVFNSIAHEVIVECLEKVNDGALVIESRFIDDKMIGSVHSSLFILRNGLHIREKLETFRGDFVKIEKSFNFKRLRQKILALISFIFESKHQQPVQSSLSSSKTTSLEKLNSQESVASSSATTTDNSIASFKKNGVLSFITPELQGSEFGVRESLEMCVAIASDKLVTAVSSPLLEILKRLEELLVASSNEQDCLKVLEEFWKSVNYIIPKFLKLLYLYLMNKVITIDDIIEFPPPAAGHTRTASSLITSSSSSSDVGHVYLVNVFEAVRLAISTAFRFVHLSADRHNVTIDSPLWISTNDVADILQHSLYRCDVSI